MSSIETAYELLEALEIDLNIDKKNTRNSDTYLVKEAKGHVKEGVHFKVVQYNDTPDPNFPDIELYVEVGEESRTYDVGGGDKPRVREDDIFEPLI